MIGCDLHEGEDYTDLEKAIAKLCEVGAWHCLIRLGSLLIAGLRPSSAMLCCRIFCGLTIKARQHEDEATRCSLQNLQAKQLGLNRSLRTVRNGYEPT